jgi:SAM-dependent methyltransferase
MEVDLVYSRELRTDRERAASTTIVEMLPPTARFSNRVADYIQFRPGYPKQLLPSLERLIGLTSDWRVADIGSGTGKLSELFLGYGCEVTGVEPNLEMREGGEKLLAAARHFTSVDGTAEHTGLRAGQFDLVVAGQAFHWFEAEEARLEFRRILSDRGWVALIWNDRQTTGTPFLNAYAELVRSLPEYLKVGHKITGAMKLQGFFESEPLVFSTPTRQEFGWKGLLGRALSSSYAPSQGQEGHDVFVDGLKAVFDQNQADGKIEFLYETQMFVGKM